MSIESKKAMQFEEREMGKDSNNTPDNEAKSISWDDLLKGNKDIDFDSIVNGIKNGYIEKGAQVNNEIPGLASNMNNDKDKEIENNEKKESTAFDLRAAANNYVNSIMPDEAGVAPNADSKSPNMPVNDIFGTVEDELLMDASNDENIAKDKDLSNVVDAELLSLLDVKQDDVKQDINVNNELETPAEQISESASLNENEAPAKANIIEDEAQPKENEDVILPKNDYDDIEFIPNKPKKKSPFALIVGVLAAGLACGLFFVFNLLGGNTTNEEDVALNPQSNYNSDTDEQTQKQAEELINKVGEQNVEKLSKENKKDKVVVQVPTGGRANPFVPSSMFDDSGNLALGADLSAPPDVSINSPEAVAARRLMTISVSGIMYDPQKPSAILKLDNMDYFVQKGDRIDTFIVRQITKEYVAIANGANVYRAYVGEAFQLDSKIPASNQMQMQNGRRQYISANDIQISIK